jgi:serine protease DegS
MGRSVAFAAQSVAAGLALAFIAVLIRPDLVNVGAPTEPSSPPSYATAVRASAPAVANVYTQRNVSPAANPFGITLRRGELGSAVVVGADGYLVTNWHVIRDADEIHVQLADGRAAEARLVGADPETELALLKIELDDLPTIAMGRSDNLQVGDVVLAIGNSLGLSQTVTMGIVSATGRGQLGVTTFEDFIQTDAAINQGNSGGALVNTRGELIGINTAVLSGTQRDRTIPEGIGFAIPVNMVRGVMTQLIEHGRVIRGYLGVDTRDLPVNQASVLGLDRPAVQVVGVRGRRPRPAF